MRKFRYFLIIFFVFFSVILNIKAYTFSNGFDSCTFDLPNNDQYFVLYTYYDNLAHDNLGIVTSDNHFYYVCNYGHPTSDNYSRARCSSFQNKVRVSESVFNSSDNYKFKDISNNEYYIFTTPVGTSYRKGYSNCSSLQNNTWVESGWAGSKYLFSTPNIDTYYYDWTNTQPNYNRVVSAPYNVSSYNVSFHLNGGTMISPQRSFNEVSFSGTTVHYQDFTGIFYDKNDLNSYLDSSSVRNDIAVFNYWYYDPQLTQPYNSNNVLNSDIDLYASYQYNSVNSILSNVSFEDYTFTDDYEYAVISVKDNFSQGAYLGIGFDFQYLQVYTYLIQNNSFVPNSTSSLSSIGSKNRIYYYHHATVSESEAYVIVLDKADLIYLNEDDELEYYYTFLVSDNCYVYFTNDLTQISYYIPSGGGTSQKLEGQDISEEYDYSQQLLLDSNSDIISMFLSAISVANYKVFSFFTTIWAKFRSIKLFSFILIITLGSFIVALIKGGARH